MAELLRISEAAKRLGVSRQRMYKLIESYHIPTVGMFGITLIDAKELLRPEITGRRDGRPLITRG